MDTKISDWNGYRQIGFTVGGRESFVVCPTQPADGNPWVWRTEFFGAFDAVDRALLARGWHLAYHAMSELYGNGTAMTYMEEFHRVAVEEMGLSARPVLFGFSRGATYAINYAHFYPAHVGAIYLDAPLTDFNAMGREAHDELYMRICACYGLNEAQMARFAGMPNDYAASIAEAGVPVAVCVGLADDVVDYKKNAAVFAERFHAAGGRLLLLEKAGVGHHPHSFSDPVNVNEIAGFLETNRLI